MDARLQYVIVVVAAVYLFTRVFNVNVGHLLAVIVSGLIIYYLNEEETRESVDFNTQMEYRLTVIGSPSHFYTDTNMINLFYNILPWRSLNPNNFDNAVQAVNNVLKLEEDTVLTKEFCVNNYDVAFDQAKLGLNLVHGFVYSIEHPLLVQKLKKVCIRLQMLLERHLDNIRTYCENHENEKGRPNIHSRFIEDAKGPKPYDPQRLSPFDYY